MAVPEAKRLSVERSTEPKKKVRFLMAGPPNVKARWCSLRQGALVKERLSRLDRELNAFEL